MGAGRQDGRRQRPLGAVRQPSVHRLLRESRWTRAATSTTCSTSSTRDDLREVARRSDQASTEGRRKAPLAVPHGFRLGVVGEESGRTTRRERGQAELRKPLQIRVGSPPPGRRRPGKLGGLAWLSRQLISRSTPPAYLRPSEHREAISGPQPVVSRLAPPAPELRRVGLPRALLPHRHRCSLAPVYAHRVAHTGPNSTHLTDKVVVSGKVKDVVSAGGTYTVQIQRPARAPRPARRPDRPDLVARPRAIRARG